MRRILFSGIRTALYNPYPDDSFICLFRNRDALQQFSVHRFHNIERVARRKLQMIHAARDLGALRVPPGNRLELLKGDRKGQHSIRVSDQWRICFRWVDGAAHDVEIVDYH